MTAPGDAATRPDPDAATDWWRTAVVYQVYPRSFADTDGDGLGDLAGILDHLDHLGPDGLGIDALWLSPIYPSPGHDVGYDVSDHRRIDPRLGTETDFDRLVDECHRRGIRVILDLVMNHTSDEHAWFTASKASREGPFANFYLWRDPAGFDQAGRPIPPNNWVSFFGGPGWQWVPERGQFYYHTFLVEQPELNWREPAVETAQWAMVRGWLERGVDGFRLDVFNAFLKHPDLPDNPVQSGDSPWNRLVHLHDIDQSEFPDLIRRFRAILDEQPGRMSIGELFYGTTEQAATYTEDGHIVFDWSLIGTTWSAASLAAAIDRREAAFGPDRWPTAFFSNHDQPRQATRFAPHAEPAERDAIARSAAVILLTLRGTAFLYYGEELGLADIEIAPGDSIDPPARLAGPDFPWYDRSGCRSPMPWTGESNGGFTTGRPWLPLNPDVATRNVASQSADPDSVLAAYRRLLAARRSSRALQRGDFRRLETDAPEVLAWTRSSGDETVLVVVNVGAGPASPTIAGLANGPVAWEPVVSSERVPGPGFRRAGPVALRGREAVVYRPAGGSTERTYR